MLATMMIGNKIAEARKKINISQAQLAQRLSISPKAVGKWERGESMPDIITLNRLAEILKVDLNYFSESFQSTATKNISDESSVEKRAGIISAKPIQKTGWDMSGGSWVDADFSGLKNISERFSNSNIQNCLFISSDLSGLLLKSNNVKRSNFSMSDLSKSHIEGSNVINNSFKECSLREICFSGSQIKGCDFTGSDFTGMVVKYCAWIKNIVTGAVWNSTAFHETQFADMVFEGVLENCSFENCGFTRVTFKNATLTNTFFKNRSLKKIQFIECKVDTMTFAFLKNDKADMTGVTLLIQ